MSDKTIISHPALGLGNRLICIASCLWISNKMDRKCRVLWLPDDDCPFDFPELFIPNSKIVLVEKDQVRELVNKITSRYGLKGGNQEIWSGKEFIYFDQPKLSPWTKRVPAFIKFHRHFKEICIHTWEGFGYNTVYFDLFKPIEKIQKEVEYYDNKFQLSSRIGVHIRATEHFTDKNRSDSYYPTSLFIEQMSKIIGADSRVKFFVSSDDQSVCKKLQDAFRGLLHISHKLMIVIA